MTTGAKAITAADDHQYNSRIAADGEGGAFVAWTSRLPGFPADVDGYLGRISSAGVLDPAWPTHGLSIVSAPFTQHVEQTVGSGDGAIVAWVDRRSGSTSENLDVYATRVSGSGVVKPSWTTNGTPISLAPGHQDGVQLCRDGLGGAWIAWVDFMAGPVTRAFVSHIDVAGSVAPGFPANGAPVTPSAIDQFLEAITPDGDGGAVLVWSERGAGSDPSDLYASRFRSNHPVAVPKRGTEALTLRISPNPSRARLVVSFASPRSGVARLELFDLAGRSITSFDIHPGGTAIVSEAAPLAPGMYLVRITQGGVSASARAVIIR